MGCPCHRSIFRRERSEEHTSELQSRLHLVCRLLLEKKKLLRTTHRATRSTKRRSERSATTSISMAQGASPRTRADPATTSSFFFNDTATTEIYTLSLHDALPISFSSPRDSDQDYLQTRSAVRAAL